MHERSPERMDAWSNRNLPLLLEEVDDARQAGRIPDAGTALNLALEAKFRGEHERAVEYFERVAFEATYPPQIRRQALVGLTSCLRRAGDVDRAIEIAEAALADLGPGADLGFELTKAFEAKEDWDAVARWAEYTIETPVPPEALVRNRLELTVAPLLGLARAELERGAAADATESFAKAAESVKGAFLRGKRAEFEAALRNDDITAARVVLREARAHYDEELKEIVRGLRFSVED
jgi:tetratricopeptide (TPR) repeat protein